MNTVALRMLCDAGWTNAAGEFISRAVLVDLNLDTGLVRQHFENDPEAMKARGPILSHGLLLFEPAGINDGSWLILRPAWDFSGKATGFHIACQSLNLYKLQLKQWARQQQDLPLIRLCYRKSDTEAGEQLAA